MSAGCRVLVVEDNVEAANGLGLLLQLEGYDAKIAYDAPHAIELAREFVPHIVLCDITLPTFDGFELARILRAEPVLGTARLVALTGHDGHDFRVKVAAAGFDAHFTKPIVMDELVGTLGKLAARE